MTSHRTSVESALARLKVFPLPSAVLFPSSVLPLHIFEPRYRELVEAALDSDGVVGLAQLEPGWEPHYNGRPPMKGLCTVGVVAWHERLADGRLNILLEGVMRAQIVDELPARASYREVRAIALPDAPYQGPEEEALKQALLDVAARVPAALGQELIGLITRARGGSLADAVASAVVPGLERRWHLLCERDVSRRMRAVLSDLGELMVRTRPKSGVPLLLN